MAAAASRGQLLAGASLLALILSSAFAVIHSTHSCRALYAELQKLESRQWHLKEDYGRLLIEQSYLASHVKVESKARDKLNMAPPALAAFKVIQP